MGETKESAHVVEHGTSLWKDAWRRLRRNRLAVFGMVMLMLMILLVIVGPWLSPYSYETQDRALGAAAPSASHWFGTDTLGRDLFTRILYGGRISLMVGFAATAVSLTIGVLYGAVAGFARGRTDAVM
ncbi:MAG: ABC transporter permease, partial [Candidatus Hydrogenedentes bacterium]|nr:ABC transporter permease [Candidatus Hydrogenedentota bacterium]